MVESLILIGPMGAGKTTIGRLLARELSIEFRDSDREIEARLGADIPWIFDMEGEEGFRRRERSVIQDLCTSEEPMVLATGGGSVLHEDNRRHLKAKGRVVYLTSSVEQLLSRIGKDRNRPLLRREDPELVLRELLAVRDPIYRSLADLVVTTDDGPPRQMVQYLMGTLRDC